jgi:phosphinothricin acetyltransferase
VAPECRRKGIGRELLQKAIDHAPSVGVRTLPGFIFAHNEPSLRLFRRYGFEERAHLPDVAELDGIERSLLILGKRVSK